MTDHAFDIVTKQFELSKKCKAMQYDPKSFLVYVPEDDKITKNILPPRIYRLRVVNYVSDSYLHCLCGFGSRYKIPCRHVISITNTIEPFMFGIRWMKLYQHAFERKNFEEMTPIFRKIELLEQKRNIESGESIYIDNIISTRANPDNYPLRLNGCTDNH